MSNTAFNSNYVSTGGSTSPATQEFRLTLTSNTPVLTTAVTGATTLYLTPYKGNSIGLYASGSWTVVNSVQVSLSLAGLLANTNYDIFAYNNAGAVALESLAWTNSGAGTSARATALAYQDGILVKSGDATRRYIGTIRTVAAGQTEFSFGAIGNTSAMEAKLFVWNYNNRVLHSARVGESTDSWTYGTSTWRSANGNAAYRVSFVCGLSEDRIQSSFGSYAITSAPGIGAGQAVGINSTSVFSGLCAFTQNTAGTPQGRYEGIVSTGFNFVQALEICNPAGTATFYGDAGLPATYQLSMLQFAFMM